ncbi:MAG: YfhO family protein [Nitrospirota bacterium]
MGKKKKVKKTQTEKFRLSRIDLLAGAGLLGLALIYFFKAATLQGIFITGDLTTSDLTNLNYPVRHFLGQCLKIGIPPLWTPDIYSGFPVFAESEMGGFYPPNLLLFFALPAYIAYNYSVILNFFLTALFFFLYARSINLSSFASFIGGFSFAFCGFFVTHLKHTNMVYAACWLPLLFFLAEMFFKNRNFIYPVLCGLVFGIQILAGHFQMAYYSILATSIYLIFRFGSSVLISTKGKDIISRFKEADLKKPALKFLGGLLIIYAIGAGLSAVQVLPTKEFTGLATRAGGVAFSDATAWPYHPKNLITFIFPYWFGDYAKGEYVGTIEGERVLFWENCGYVGIFTLLLAFLGIIVFFLKTGEVRFFTILGIFSILLTLGKYTPLYEFLWNYLPGLKFFRFPNRFLLLVSFCLCILAGFGIRFILSQIKNISTKRMTMVIIAMVIICDLFKFGFYHNPTVKPDVWLAKPKTVEFLEKDKSLYRVYNFACDESWQMVYSSSKGWKGNLNFYVNHREVLHPNFNMIYNIPSCEGYPAFAPIRLNNLHNFFRNLDNVSLYKHRQDDLLGFTVPKPQFTKLLGILNVKYILSFWEMNSPVLKEVFQVPFNDMIPARLYENKEVIPKAYIVPKAKVIKDEGKILEELIKPEFNPREYVVVEEEMDFAGSEAKGAEVKEVLPQIAKYSPLEVLIEANLLNCGFLVLADTYYPCWKVFIDGKEGKIYRANYIQRAVSLKEGKHKIRFVYDPFSFKIGALISIITLLSTLIYFGYKSKRFRIKNYELKIKN